MDGIVLTRDTLLRLGGFKPGPDLRRSRHATIKALKAMRPGYVDGAGQEHPPAPDHATRLKAAVVLASWHGLTAQRSEGTTTNVLAPIQITWTLPAPSVSSHPALGNGKSTNGSNGSTSSSATGDSGKPSWL